MTAKKKDDAREQRIKDLTDLVRQAVPGQSIDLRTQSGDTVKIKSDDITFLLEIENERQTEKRAKEDTKGPAENLQELLDSGRAELSGDDLKAHKEKLDKELSAKGQVAPAVPTDAEAAHAHKAGQVPDSQTETRLAPSAYKSEQDAARWAEKGDEDEDGQGKTKNKK